MLELEAERNGAGGREAKRAVGERSAAAAGGTGSAQVPDPELVEKARRRRFTARYKQRILREADACTRPGEIGALLRREGLYTSQLSTWRKQREEGVLGALSRRRGRRKTDPLKAENADLRRRLERVEADLAKAHRVIEVQGNVSALLGELLRPESERSQGSSDA
jgi:transposase-like protein